MYRNLVIATLLPFPKHYQSICENVLLFLLMILGCLLSVAVGSKNSPIPPIPRSKLLSVTMETQLTLMMLYVMNTDDKRMQIGKAHECTAVLILHSITTAAMLYIFAFVISVCLSQTTVDV